MSKNDSPILVTGAAGFIGYSLIKELLLRGYNVYGISRSNELNNIFLPYNNIYNLVWSLEHTNLSE